MSASALHKHTVDNVGSPERDTTTVVVHTIDFDGDDTAFVLVDLIADLQEALNDIPEEFRDNAAVRITGYGDYVSTQGEVTFRRPETDDELADRRRWLASLKEEDDERDAREFERLKAKFKS